MSAARISRDELIRDAATTRRSPVRFALRLLDLRPGRAVEAVRREGLAFVGEMEVFLSIATSVALVVLALFVGEGVLGERYGAHQKCTMSEPCASLVEQDIHRQSPRWADWPNDRLVFDALPSLSERAEQASACGFADQRCLARKCTVPCWYAGRCTKSDTGDCIASSDADCRASKECSYYGACRRSDSGTCEARVDTDCLQSLACAKYGRCTRSGERCVPSSEEHCRASRACLEHGMCAHAGDRCEPSSDQDCRASAACKREGRCKVEQQADSRRCE
jgi:hypothetical protein